jgi:tetratricopeptide (TPR) repeat protein
MGPGSALLALWLAAVSPQAAQPPAPGGAPDAEYYFLVGRHLEGEGRLDDAVTALKRAIELAPKNAEPQAELAALYARQDKAGEAVDAAEAALAIDPKNREANRILGTVLAALAEQRQPAHPGDDVSAYPRRAIAALEIARGDGTGDLSIDLALARLYMQARRPADAVPLLRRILLENPQYTEGALLLAQAQQAADAPADALATIDAVLAQDPSIVRARVLQAQIREQQHQWTEAAESWKAAQELLPSNTEVAARRAMALLNSGDAAAAEDAARTLRAANPQDVRGLYVLGVALESQARFAEALPVLEEAARRAPDNTAILYQYSAALDRSGRQADAEKSLRAIIARDPLDANALNYLGYMLAERGSSLDEAVQLIERALKIDPDNPSFLDSLGWAYVRQGKLDLADRPLTTAAERQPKNSVIQDHLGDLRIKQQRTAEAVAAWQRALDGDGESIDRARIEKKISDARR